MGALDLAVLLLGFFGLHHLACLLTELFDGNDFLHCGHLNSSNFFSNFGCFSLLRKIRPPKCFILSGGITDFLSIVSSSNTKLSESELILWSPSRDHSWSSPIIPSAYECK